MGGCRCLVLAVCLGLLVDTCYSKRRPTLIEHRMPGVQPRTPDTYLCHALKVQEATNIIGFIPHANKETAHHMLLYGCKTPGSSRVWNCGEMFDSEKDNTKSQFQFALPCETGPVIIYAWARDAPSLNLPTDVGFRIGGNSGINYLVLQVHYKNVDKFLPPRVQEHNMAVLIGKQAGVYVLGTNGIIEPKSTVYMEAACKIDEDIIAYPFAYRTHAHAHGKVNSGYVIRDGKWTEIGRKNPQLPQMFYNVTHPGMTIRRRDILAARCTMKNDEERVVRIGSTQHDEMCNFYIMYYVKSGGLLSSRNCFSPGPPHWSWKDFPDIHLENAPRSVSVVPETDEVLEETSPSHPDSQSKKFFLTKQYETPSFGRGPLDTTDPEYGPAPPFLHMRDIPSILKRYLSYESGRKRR